VVSPADGRVLVAVRLSPERHLKGSGSRVKHLPVAMDVHVNRVPVAVASRRVSSRQAKFCPLCARMRDVQRTAAKSGSITAARWLSRAQIVGILARRVVCRLKVGATVQAGERYGVMKFGSRMDVFLPLSAEILVQVGATVRAAETVIAVLH
jgi:phosphatidylserine decarboxylase